MDGEYRTLWKAIRRPMLKWWTRTGLWLLASIVALHATDAFGGYAYRYSSPGFGRAAISVVAFLPTQLMLGVAWLWAATVCNRLVSLFFEEHAAPEPQSLLRARFVLAYAQGLVPLGITLILRLIEPRIDLSSRGLYVGLHSVYQVNFVQAVESLDSVLSLVLPDALLAIWLVGLLVVSPRRLLLPWMLLLVGAAGQLLLSQAYVLGTAFALRLEICTVFAAAWIVSMGYFARRRPSFAWALFFVGMAASLMLLPAVLFLPLTPLGADQIGLYTYWGWFLSALIVLSMLYAQRRGIVWLANACGGVLMAAILGKPLITAALFLNCQIVAPSLARLSFDIPRFLSDSPFAWWVFLTSVDRVHPASQSSMRELAHLLPVIVEPLWVLAMLALMYCVILGPRIDRSSAQAV